jgi:hypothetical protein
MIVWLASYPRSGNTLLRMILNRCFGLSSYSVYRNTSVASAWMEVVGHVDHEDPSAETFVDRARRSDETFLIKTHEFPAPEHAEIYVVRDGRAALASYQRFLRDREGVEIGLEQLASGAQWPGSWADHVETWLDRAGPRQLLLRYEELCAGDGPPLERIGAFLGKPVLRRFDVGFPELRAASPTFFGVGRDAPGIDLVERTCSEAFWRVNGGAMRRLGYARRGRFTERIKRVAGRLHPGRSSSPAASD